MADSKEMMVKPYRDLVQELPSSADHTALLYHLSYLYLSKFPRLQMTLRLCAFETQLLFAFSVDILDKCEYISDQMASLVLPDLKLAVEKDDTTWSTGTLEKAKGWIKEIVTDVKDIVDRYEKHIQDVTSCTSDVVNEPSEMGRTTNEIETLEKVVNDLQMELRKTLEEVGRFEAKIGQRIASNTMSDLSVLAAILPLAGAIVKSMSKPDPVTLLINQRAQRFTQRSDLKSQQQNIQVRLTDANIKLANLKTENGSNLSIVQKCLYQIHQTLIQYIVFWNSVQVILEDLNNGTFVHDHFIGESELKGFILKYIDPAQEEWKAFGESCLKAKNVFSLKDKDAFDFLHSSSPFL